MMTHAELVTRAGKWLRNTKRLPVVLCESSSTAYECPDVIGFDNRGTSVLIECKVSLSDFERDAKKSFRRDPARGMGVLRWYAFPEELFNKCPRLAVPSQIPERWGVVIFRAKQVKVWLHPTPFVARNEPAERTLLVSAFRRATEGWGRTVFPELRNGDPHPSISSTMKAWQRDLDAMRTNYYAARDRERVLLAKLRDTEERANMHAAAVGVLEEKLRRKDLGLA